MTWQRPDMFQQTGQHSLLLETSIVLHHLILYRLREAGQYIRTGSIGIASMGADIYRYHPQ